MSNNINQDLETKIIHWGHSADPTTGALATPIYQTATFAAKTVEHFEELCMTWGYVYTRECNPTLTELEAKLAMLENAESAISSTSGMGAITSTILALVKSGDHIVSSDGIFSHTKLFMSELLSKFGVEVTFVDAVNPQNVKEAMRPNTKIVYIESPLNPSLDLVDIKTIAEIAHENKSLAIVDSTFGTPIVQRPIDLGADLVIHSLTKFINGHGDTLGGAVAGSKELIDLVRWPSLCCFTGASLPPMSAWMILRGMKTLDMRMKKHCENGLAVAEFLEEEENVELVKYPALKSHPQYELCKTQMNGLGGGVVSFKLKDGINGLTRDQASRRLMNSLELATIATSLGEEHTLVQMNGENLIRIAVGLESSNDIINDFKQAIEKLK
ncbi:TPA: aminotransferase class I/II-fold pyridoxal phosphate-dependent enzyme [Clostridioides difficile]|uniref:trans-sulfuration enzyme family protein n=1 Tax=Clostridioides difficile TaxID=1496 RepID=UPI00097FF7A2|nr:aminotransferase class I/II-fold pyridoxal phosphate-dependent enzyme [Clostridioides difficile]EGT3848804.1 aminotransferase class I/II-fold pyridoxal phosphate-dependent enzyme [Clostridioides difficile]EGT4203487.1 aminotransferase class I/II-fold pyridoxal phosphate-dependent enzyme [Clostridioides difficile]EKG0757741.1 aminotransferase class I/II-fold pyridoxal phosphate-dependent enzyme [Clostridioides difficile]EKG0785162.1 aminotransferase class I/II-fold pyridoxal phosphate-depende